ncbi:MAG: hypothetical protein EP341_00025 [Sphingomonadales bacterium]|nr:MAG: hypothetical protein EP341_00025 [Sphingomonadales bacterium]
MLSESRSITAALSALIILQLVMLGALYAQVPPHPPATIPLFAIAPFLAVALATAAAALIVGPVAGRTGRALSLLAGLMALLSFGPQKYLDPQFPLIWPAVLAAQVAVIAVFVGVLFRQGQRSA